MSYGRKRSFTLIELIVVVIVATIFATLGTVMYKKAIANADNKAAIVKAKLVSAQVIQAISSDKIAVAASGETVVDLDALGLSDAIAGGLTATVVPDGSGGFTVTVSGQEGQVVSQQYTTVHD